MSSAESTPGRSQFRVAHWSLVVSLLLGVLLRLLYLDADPYYYAWSGYLTDEGRWIETARSLALQGTSGDYGFDLHFLIAPLFQLLHYPILALVGVSFWSTRLPTAVAGCALLALVLLRLRNRVSPSALFLGFAVLATNADLVMLSRVAVPETALMLVETLIFFTIFSDVESRRKICAAASITLIGLGVKATLAPMVLVFALVILGMSRQKSEAATVRRRLANAGLYLAAVTGPLAVAAFAALVGGFPIAEYLPPYFPLLEKLLQPSNLFGLVSYPFESLLSPTFNIMCLAAWLGGLVFWAQPGERSDGVSWRLFVGAGIWSVGYFVPMQLLGYFPHRYQVHILVPLALMAISAADALGSVGLKFVRDALDQRRGRTRFAAAALAGLPVSAIAAPGVLFALSALGADPDRFRSKLVAWALSAMLVAAGVAVLPRARRAWMFLLSFPLIFSGTWLVLSLTRFSGPFWPSGGTPIGVTAWGATAALAGAIWLIGVAFGRRGWKIPEASGAVLVGWTYLIVSLLAIAPGFVTPRYTIRDASRDLGRLLAGADSVTSHSADALFNENTVPYRSYYRIDPIRQKADFFVSGSDEDMFFMFREMLDTDYTPVKVYQLHLAPDFRKNYLERGGSPESAGRVTIYQRNGEVAEKPPEGIRDGTRSDP